jgi:hypothetical protein
VRIYVCIYLSIYLYTYTNTHTRTHGGEGRGGSYDSVHKTWERRVFISQLVFAKVATNRRQLEEGGGVGGGGGVRGGKTLRGGDGEGAEADVTEAEGGGERGWVGGGEGKTKILLFS